MADDHYHNRERARLMAQLKSGCYVRIYHFGTSPSHVFMPSSPSSASTVRDEVAREFLTAGHLSLFESGWNFDVYQLRLTEHKID